MVYVATGTRKFMPPHYAVGTEVLDSLSDGTLFISGCAGGWDTFFAVGCARRYPNAHHHLVVPNGHHNEGLVKDFESSRCLVPRTNVTIERMPPDTGFLDRDLWMIDLAAPYIPDATCVAMALHEERRQPRSGTWATVRMARRAGVAVRDRVLVPLELTDPFPELG